ncbi:MAG: tyrosine-type recombinase/integrase [Synergistaceae bacterium]|nr:tyrosine-type recombinase/integrase [Synergistaceae bacterium]
MGGKLTNSYIESLKFDGTRRIIADGDGLILEVMPSGAKVWRFRLRRGRTEYKDTFGRWTDGKENDPHSLSRARVWALEKMKEVRAAETAGVELSVLKKQEKSETITFDRIAREWYKKTSHTWKKSHEEKQRQRLEKLCRLMGERSMSKITRQDLIVALERVNAKSETGEETRKCCGVVKQIWEYGLNAGYIENDITTGVRSALTRPRKEREHYPSITEPKKIGALLRAIDGYDSDGGGSMVVRMALQLHAYVFLRPGELAAIEWSFIDWEEKVIRLPKGLMKKGEEHVVPMAQQVVALLREMQKYSGRGRYVFPLGGDFKHSGRHMSTAAEGAALRRMGYDTKAEITPHGFRAMAETRLNEARKPDGSRMWSVDAIERQLDHKERNSSRAPYDRGTRLEERIELMQWWSDYLDQLREEKK